MAVHDWTRVDAGIFHHFHHSWIEEIQRALNKGLLPSEYYALAEQHTGAYGPDVLALQHSGSELDDNIPHGVDRGPTTLLMAEPKTRVTVESALAFYRRKQATVVVRHVSGDKIVAMVEVVSPGNKHTRGKVRLFVEKVCNLVDKGVHMLILDVHPPCKHDPRGIHARIWEDLEGAESDPLEKRCTLTSYEAGLTVRAFLETAAVGDALPDMPLFLEPRAHVNLSLETTYLAAFDAVPRRWRAVLEAAETA